MSGADLSGADLWEANLQGADLSEADLHGANLSTANLQDANLVGVDLHGADLTKANLCGANLAHADLTAANLFFARLEKGKFGKGRLSNGYFRNADLRGADLRGADLSGADLRGADLSRADLTTADLTSANLRQAVLAETSFEGAMLSDTLFGMVDLSATRKLAAAVHRGPSSIDTHTLSLCGWRLPLEFVRGCGLRDWEIESAKLHDPMLSPPETAEITNRVHELRHQGAVIFYSVFISYSHTDKAFARRLHDALQPKGIRCWLDEKQLLPGDDIHQEITKGIRLWDKVLLCASDAALKSWWVKDEIETVFAKERLLSKERNGADVRALIPLNLDGALFRWEHGYREQVVSRRAADFAGWESPRFDFDRVVDDVIRALRADGGGREAPPPPRL